MSSRLADRVLRRSWFVAATCAVVTMLGCAPKLAPLVNATPARDPLPQLQLAPRHQRIVFTWRLADGELTIRGEGAARVSAPDSARLDLFVAGGLGSGTAYVLGDSLTMQAPDALRRVLPPPAFLWAALGRLTVPAGRDTLVARLDSIIDAEIGPDPRWRIRLANRRVMRLEHAQGDRVIDRLERQGDSSLVYTHGPSRRQLVLRITRADSVGAFDAAIWTP
jgi:hypothetical protein